MHATESQTTTSATESDLMSAVTQTEFGVDPHAVLTLGRIGRPEPQAGEVVVRVEAAGVDRGVWHLMAGRPYAVRLAGYGIRHPKHAVPGMDVSGVVVAVGDGVDRFAIGDDVMGIGIGTFAEYARAEASKLVHRPARLSAAAAAVTAISGLTALQAVRDHGQVRRGDSVLVLGASGGVGSFAVQIAVALGADVTGVARASKLDAVRGLGAHRVIDHTTTGIDGHGGGYDVIIDTGGNRPLRELRHVLAADGRLVIVGGETDGRWLGGTDRQLRAMIMSRFVSQHLGTFISSENGEDLADLVAMIEAGDVTPLVDRSFPLDRAADAIDHLTEGRTVGKVALVVAS
jgi:NADPH:quinone reductase-like Zn-dependent oxidoreductase